MSVSAHPARSSADFPCQTSRLVSDLSALLTELNISHQKNLLSIANASQVWRRKPDQERWEMPGMNLPPRQEARIMALLKRIGLVNEKRPDKQHYDYALLMGATAQRMRSRLRQLAKSWKAGVRFDEIVFLTGHRPLIPSIDKIELLVSQALPEHASEKERAQATPVTEMEAAQMLFHTMDLPEGMKKVRVSYAASPRTWIDKRWQRGNTRQSVQRWLTNNPEPGAVLVVSDQPHACYQQEVVSQELPSVFNTDITAEAARPEARLPLYLDGLALWLHNLKIRLNKAKNM